MSFSCPDFSGLQREPDYSNSGNLIPGTVHRIRDHAECMFAIGHLTLYCLLYPLPADADERIGDWWLKRISMNQELQDRKVPTQQLFGKRFGGV